MKSYLILASLFYPTAKLPALTMLRQDSSAEEHRKIREWKQRESKKADVGDMMLELERAKQQTVVQPKPNPIVVPAPKSESVKYVPNKENKVVEPKATLPAVKPDNAFYAQLDSLLANAKNDAVVENSVTNFIANGDKSAQERLFVILQNNEKTKQYFDKYSNRNTGVIAQSTNWLSLIASCLIGIVGTVILTKPILNKITKHRRDKS
jgi:hypothetical protein